MSDSGEIVGVIPAAGYARRISPLPCSKEIYPIVQPDGSCRAAASYLMENLRKASVERAFMILREGKWDIPSYFSEEPKTGLDLAYVVTEATGGVPQTINKAYPFIKEDKVLFGFPDIILRPSSAYVSLLGKQAETGADLVLGIFKARDPRKMDMVDFNDKGAIEDIVIKPEKTSLMYTWIIAAWTPVFTGFLRDFIIKSSSEGFSGDETSENKGELYIGDVFREAIQSGIKASSVRFEGGAYLDIGTPSELKKAGNVDWTGRFNAIV
ncbi:glucose-1-phosphate thymidylyltransferase [Fodinibius roseus]|uniref:glucose-1-phosphate thymidylyltransferase n=1 Tax=Fodinibius roseus TaxID=1194090 RepID=A0A1M4SUD1_9BACT|nr:sugar phosphate nucleotidyltransferase [Fodinibius roseus]SHE35805.1 glucose-1-phosphate thymidylyltransferase [Fodinibius roseus]